MSLGLTTHDEKRIFKGEPVIARAGVAGSIRGLASYLLEVNAEVGAERHWRHGRHGEGSRREPLILTALPNSFRPGHMAGATCQVTPPRKGGNR